MIQAILHYGNKGAAVKASSVSGLYRWALALNHGEPESAPQRALERVVRKLQARKELK